MDTGKSALGGIDGNIAAERPLYVHHVPAPPSTVN